MAAIPGTVVGSPIVPSDSADTYPTHKSIYGMGGHMSVADNTARDAIPATRREIGMLVYVTGTATMYQLVGGITNGDWQAFTAGMTGPQGMTGIIGTQGVTGVQGVTGSQGMTGVIGTQGVTGVQGVTGIIGLQGVTGVQGVTGIVGGTGVQGMTGVIGTQGVTGVFGMTGVQGATGMNGMTGLSDTHIPRVVSDGKLVNSEILHETGGEIIAIFSGGCWFVLKCEGNSGHMIQNFGSVINGFLSFIRGRGTISSPTAISANDWIGEIDFQGYVNGSNYSPGARIYAYAVSNFTTGNTESKIAFELAPNGSATPVLAGLFGTGSAYVESGLKRVACGGGSTGASSAATYYVTLEIDGTSHKLLAFS